MCASISEWAESFLGLASGRDGVDIGLSTVLVGFVNHARGGDQSCGDWSDEISISA